MTWLPNPSVGSNGAAIPGSSNLIGVKDGSGNIQPVGSANPVRVDPTGTTTQPVSGTVTANAGTGTMAVSAAALPLPAGASTAAKQPALGTAGSASADVISVQGIASMTALKVDGSGVTQPVSGTVTANAGTGTMATQDLSSAATAAAVPAKATYVGGNKAGNLVGLALDGSGNLNVNVAAGSSGNAASSATGSAVPAQADYLGASDGTNLRGLLVESSTNPNLRTGIYSGANEATVTGANALKVDGSAVNQPVTGSGTTNTALVTITSATAVGTTWSLANGSSANTCYGIGGIRVGTVTGGIITVEGSADNSNWVAVRYSNQNATTNMWQPAGTTIGFVNVSTTGALYQLAGPFAYYRLRLSTALVGSGSIVLSYAAQALPVFAHIDGSVDLNNVAGPVTAGGAASNSVLNGAVYTTTAPSLTNNQQVASQCDIAGNVKTVPGVATQTLTAWTSVNFTAAATFNLVTTYGGPAVIVQLNQTTPFTAGAVTWQGTYDGTNWVTIPANQVLDPTSATFQQIANPYTFVASTNKSFLILMGGYQQIRANASTALTGAGTVTPNVTQLSYVPSVQRPSQDFDVKVYTGTATGAAAQLFVQAGKKWKILSLAVVVGTNATAASRQVYITSSTLNVIPANLTQAASLTYTYNFAAGLATQTSTVTASGATVACGFPETWLPNGGFIQSNIGSVQSGDTNSITATVLEYNA